MNQLCFISFPMIINTVISKCGYIGQWSNRIFVGSYFFVWLVLSCGVLSPVWGQSLAVEEQQIQRYVQQQQTKQLALLKTLVNINSGTNNIPGVLRVGSILQRQLEELGFKTRWVQEPESMQRAATLIAEHKGEVGKKILLIGHLDTVFPLSSPFQHFKREGDKARGPGVIDDKGGDVVIVYALKALQAVHALEKANITVVLTGDEEDSGKPTSISRKPLLELARQSDIALDFECAITLNTATIARRGITDWELRTQGHESHSAGIYKLPVGFGAIYELARILDAFRLQLSQERYLTINPGLISGGTSVHYEKESASGEAVGKTNVVAKSAFATGDLRYLTAEQKKLAENKMQIILRQHLPGTNATLTFQDGIPAMSPTVANLQLLNHYSAASEALGYGLVKPIDPGFRGAGDISYVSSIVSASLSGLGPAGDGAHSIDETIDIASLPVQTARAAVLIYRLTHL